MLLDKNVKFACKYTIYMLVDITTHHRINVYLQQYLTM